MAGTDERIERSRLLYERAILAGEAIGLDAADQALDAVEADLALARGRVRHGRFLTRREEDPDGAVADPRELALFERAAGLYRALGDERGEAAALFWTGCFHQVTGRDNATAVPLLSRSLELAERAGDPVTAAEALRHLGIADHAAGRLDAARGWRNRPGCAGKPAIRPAWPPTRSGWPTSPSARTGPATRERCWPRLTRWPRRMARGPCCATSPRRARRCKPASSASPGGRTGSGRRRCQVRRRPLTRGISSGRGSRRRPGCPASCRRRAPGSPTGSRSRGRPRARN